MLFECLSAIPIGVPTLPRRIARENSIFLNLIWAVALPSRRAPGVGGFDIDVDAWSLTDDYRVLISARTNWGRSRRLGFESEMGTKSAHPLRDFLRAGGHYPVAQRARSRKSVSSSSISSQLNRAQCFGPLAVKSNRTIIPGGPASTVP